MIGAPIRHIAGQNGAEVVHVLGTYGPKPRVFSLASIYSGSALHMCRLASVRERLVFVAFSPSCKPQGASTEPDNTHLSGTIRVSKVARSAAVPTPQPFPSVIVIQVAVSKSVRRVGVGLEHSCATSYSRCLPALPACCAYHDYPTWSS